MLKQINKDETSSLYFPIVATGYLGIYGKGMIAAFTSNSTFIVPSGVNKIRVRVVGGGGLSSSTTTNGFGGAGGAGFAIGEFAVNANATYTITVGGQSGTSSFGNLISATGGESPGAVFTGGAGGIGIGGYFQASGGAGGLGYSTFGGGGNGAAGSLLGKGGNGGNGSATGDFGGSGGACGNVTGNNGTTVVGAEVSYVAFKEGDDRVNGEILTVGGHKGIVGGSGSYGGRGGGHGSLAYGAGHNASEVPGYGLVIVEW